MREVFSDRARMTAWLDVEVALATAQARVGVIPLEVAERIACAAKFENLDVAAMKEHYDRVGFPISPLVKQLAGVCDPESAKWIHWGATTQDVIDTGLVLQMREGLILIEADLEAIAKALETLVNEHRTTVMAGRTFQQYAAPITFGYKAAVWLDEILRHQERLPGLKERALMGQLGGAVGTLATLGDRGYEVRHEFMKELSLPEPAISWHTARDGWAELIHWLGMVGATLGKFATEIAVLMRSEVGELREPAHRRQDRDLVRPGRPQGARRTRADAWADAQRCALGSQDDLVDRGSRERRPRRQDGVRDRRGTRHLAMGHAVRHRAGRRSEDLVREPATR